MSSSTSRSADPSTTDSVSEPLLFPYPLPSEFHGLRDRLRDWLPRLATGGHGYRQSHQALLEECERVRELGSEAQRRFIDDLARLAAPWTSSESLRQLPSQLHFELLQRAWRMAEILHIRRKTPAWVPRAIGWAIALPCGYALVNSAWDHFMPGAGSLPLYLERKGRQAAYIVENASTLELSAGLAVGMMAVGWYTLRAARSV
ncbi:MAG: hypothetical protein ACKO38_12950 [Planctomycetota bacterium]